MIRRFSCIVALGLAASTAACSAPDRSGEPLGEKRSLIQGGQDDTTDSNVVGIGILASQGIESCSGTLIAPNVVLTAHHCVAQPPPGYVVCGQSAFAAPYDPSSFYVTTHPGIIYDLSIYHRATEVRVPDGGNDICGYDVGLLILQDVIDPSEAKPIIPRIDTSLVSGDIYDAVGYGLTCSNPDNQGNCPNGSAGTRRRLNDLTVNCVGPECPFDPQAMTDGEWNGEKGVCSGDSGGPALDKQGRVVGVASRGGGDNAGNCLDPIYSRVDSWKDFITQAVLDGAAQGGYAPPYWATSGNSDPNAVPPDTTPDSGAPAEAGAPPAGLGTTCTTSSDCPAPLACLSGSPNYCTQLCSAQSSACPEGYTCDANVGACAQNIGAPAADADSSSSGSCSLARAGADPTKPVPWIVGLALLPLLRRRRRGS